MLSVSITAAEAICALGNSLEESMEAWTHGRSGLEPMGGAGPFAHLPVGRISDRSLLGGRRYGAATNLALHAATRAVQRAGWTPQQIRETWIFGATSRGNLGEVLGENRLRRPIRRLSASNSLHSEIAAAISIELGIRGPWQMISNGCASGLDALGLAWMAVGAGLAPRALVVAVDLPLVAPLLAEFHDTHLLSSNALNDPFASDTTGLLPGEATAAVTLEPGSLHGLCTLATYRANSDAFDALMIPPDWHALTELVGATLAGSLPKLVCPHATGTPNHARAEPLALANAFRRHPARLLPLKPFTGHSLGASGLLDTALLAAAMARGTVPGCLPGLTAPQEPLSLATEPTAFALGDSILKIASGMGGHNAGVLLRHAE